MSAALDYARESILTAPDDLEHHALLPWARGEEPLPVSEYRVLDALTACSPQASSIEEAVANIVARVERYRAQRGWSSQDAIDHQASIDARASNPSEVPS